MIRGPLLVRRPGKADRSFVRPQQAIDYLVEHPGPARVFDADGRLLFTRGSLSPEA